MLDVLVQHLLPQVGGAIIVDNGSTMDMDGWHRSRQDPRLQLHLIGENLGIAAAQNIGLAEARRRRAEFVLLSDQDSHPAPDMVFQLARTARRLIASGVKLAAVGPRYLDIRQNNPPPFTQVKGLRLERQWCRSADSVVEVDYLIASGCLIPMEALSAVGEMKEEMFIDYVDIEWGLRAKQLGYRSYGVCAAAMAHRLGDYPIAFMGKRYTLHSPARHYYRFRNAVWLYKQRGIPLQWKIADGIRLCWKFFFYSMFAKPRHRHCSLMTIGLWHGLRSRLGKCEL